MHVAFHRASNSSVEDDPKPHPFEAIDIGAEHGQHQGEGSPANSYAERIHSSSGAVVETKRHSRPAGPISKLWPGLPLTIVLASSGSTAVRMCGGSRTTCPIVPMPTAKTTPELG